MGLKEAIDAVTPYWPGVFCVGIGWVIGSNRIWEEFLFLDLLIFLSITIIVYGRIASNMAPVEKASAWTILKENGLNYFLAVVLMGAPQIALRVLLARHIDSLFMYVMVGTFISATFAVLTIYVLPIVFLKKSSLAAFLAGVTFFFRNLAASGWIAGVVILTQVLSVAGVMIFRIEATPISFVFALVAAVSGVFLTFVAYAAALRVLLGGSTATLLK